MQKAAVVKYRDEFRKLQVSTDVLCDNNMTFRDNGFMEVEDPKTGDKKVVSNSLISWNDSTETFVNIRSNPEIGQMKAPFEVNAVPYEIIFYIRADLNKEQLKQFLKDMGITNADKIYSALVGEIGNLSLFTSTGDGIEYAGEKGSSPIKITGVPNSDTYTVTVEN